MKKKEIEGTVEYFPRTLIAAECGRAVTADGKTIHIPAREFANGFNGHRTFAKKGMDITAVAIEHRGEYYALSWDVKK